MCMDKIEVHGDKAGSNAALGPLPGYSVAWRTYSCTTCLGSPNERDQL